MNPPFDSLDGSEPLPESDQGTLSIPAEDRPCFHVSNEWFRVREHDGKLKPGVWHFGTKATKDELTLTCTPVCSPLHIEAVTCDKTNNNFGRLLRFLNTRGQWREWAMPMELTAGAAELMHKEMLAMGVVIHPRSKMLLADYLIHRTPERRVLCATQVGWLNNWFVLPDEVLGSDRDDVVFQGAERGEEHGCAGTLDSWRSEVASLSRDNPLLILALSAAFAGPLMQRCSAEGGGLHFVGDSSTGKTTLLDAACSVWGGPSYKRSWRATANGLEGAASLFNDCLFAIDEISQCEPREVGAIVYALGNGVGKQRAARAGNARPITRWRCFVLSSGERSVATSMAEGGYRIKAGQGIRLLDVGVSRPYGAFDTLHGHATGAALADAVKRAAASSHGHAGREFVRRLLADPNPINWPAKLAAYRAKPEFLSPDQGEGQDKRAAARFALLGLAGEAARAYGLTGWAPGDACNAAAIGLAAWRAMRSQGNSESRQICEQIYAFIERHGDSRFSDINAPSEKPIKDRAGWWNSDGVEIFYLFTGEGLREALKGFDFKRSLDTLSAIGALPPPDPHGQTSRAQRIFGRAVRLYPVRAEKLG